VATSVGIAHARPEDGAEELLRNADVAMYRAKRRGQGGHEVFAPEMHAALLDRLALEADLRDAVVDGAFGDFHVLYQPIVELAGGRATGAEALVRWRHPQRGLVSPGEFIPIAEATGLVVPLGEWVLRQACAQGARWQAMRDAAGDPSDLTITVNISGRQLQHPGLLHAVATALDDTGLRASSLVLEITESVIMQDTETNLATLHALKEIGVRLAIDDFGTGYSSLSALRLLPVDVLKIDRSFVMGMVAPDATQASGETAIASAVIALAHSLGLTVIAEGVETPQQHEFLRLQRCDAWQGFLACRPVAPEKLREYLTSRDASLAATPDRQSVLGD